MTDEIETGADEALTDEAKAYFESRGEKGPQAEQAEDGEAGKEPVKETGAEEIDESGDGEQAAKGDKTVPLRAVTKEREERKAAQRELQELRTKHAVLEDRWNTFIQATQAQQQAQPQQKVDDDPMPDPQQDIFAYSAWQQRQIDKMSARFDEREQAEKRQQQESSQEAQIWDHWGRSVAAVKGELPDFGDAATFLSDARTKQLQAYAAVDPRFGDPNAINRQIDSELRQIVVAAAQAGTNPAKAVYELAKSWGYAGPKPATNADPGKVVEKIAKSMEAETSLSEAGGSSARGTLSAEDIANMSPDEFEAWFAKHGERGFKRIAGRAA